MLSPSAALSPPASDINITFSPLGLTRTMSRSSGSEWTKDWSVTVTLMSSPESPETGMTEGKGFAGPLDGMTMRFWFTNTTPGPGPMIWAWAWARVNAGTKSRNNVPTQKQAVLRVSLGFTIPADQRSLYVKGTEKKSRKTGMPHLD